MDSQLNYNSLSIDPISYTIVMVCICPVKLIKNLNESLRPRMGWPSNVSLVGRLASMPINCHYSVVLYYRSHLLTHSSFISLGLIHSRSRSRSRSKYVRVVLLIFTTKQMLVRLYLNARQAFTNKNSAEIGR